MATNVSSNSTARYVFLPVDIRVRVTLFSFVGFCGFYAILANGMILYLINKLKSRKGRTKSFDRSFVNEMFIQSLAVSDLLCACIAMPLAITLNFFDIVKGDLTCKAVRFSNIFFPIVTINNLVIIGIERYLAVFHPFRVPTPRTVKYLVGAAWLLGVVITIIPCITYRLLKVDVGPEIYTNICIYDKTVNFYKIIMFVFSGFMFIAPALILSVTNTRIILFLLRKRKIEHKNIKKKWHRQQMQNSWRFKGTATFIALIFTFLIPYFFFVVFTAMNIVMRLQMTFTEEYIMRRMTMVFANSNSVISPTVLLLTMPNLRGGFRSFLSKHFLCLRKTRIAVVLTPQQASYTIPVVVNFRERDNTGEQRR